MSKFVKGHTSWRPHLPFRNKEYLLAEYVSKQRSATDIGREFGVGGDSVCWWLKRHGIPRRNMSEARSCKSWGKKGEVAKPATKEELNEYARLKRLAFPEEHRARHKKSYDLHREERIRQGKDWRRRNPEKMKRCRNNHRLANIESYRERDNKRRPQKRIYVRNKWKTDLNFRLATILRKRLFTVLNGTAKADSALKLLGCSLANLQIYLESQFETGMSWENYGRGQGKWNIDHIVPCALFDLSNLEHQRRCFHFSNLAPMWSLENSRKGARGLAHQFKLL